MRWHIDMEVDSNKVRKKFPIGDLDIPDSTNLLAPKATMPRFVAADLKERTRLVTSDKGALFIWGIVYYRDGFGNERWTKFCHRYEQDCMDKTGMDALGGDNARQHQYGNGTDEDEKLRSPR